MKGKLAPVTVRFCQGVDVAACGAELQLQLIGRRDAAAAPCV